MLSPGSLLQFDWHNTGEGREMLSCIFTRNKQRMKTFGLLERPPLSPHVEEASYKLFVAGKSGVGKTATVSKLTGNELPKTHFETPGIQTTTCYWPVKVTDLNKVVLFKLQFYDVGEGALKKFDHILSTCTDKTDAVIVLFSIIDKSSFDELHQLLSRLSTPNDNRTKLVIASKCDQHAHSEVTQRDIHSFESSWKIPVLKVKNVLDANQSDVNDTIYIMNRICEHLWYRDLILAGKITKPSSDRDLSSIVQTSNEEEYV